MIFKFNTAKAIQYANTYLKTNNYFFKKFEDVRENTSFISQCILAGSDNQMCKKEDGWFYSNEKDHSLSWIDTNKLWEFLLKTNCGPFGRSTSLSNLEVGDIVFFGNENDFFNIGIVTKYSNGDFFVAIKSKNKEISLDEIACDNKKFLHLIGVKK